MLGNQLSGITAGGLKVMLGGTAPGAGNVIAGIVEFGISYYPNTEQSTFRQNSVHSNGWMGIVRLFGGPYLDVPVLAWDGANAVQGTAIAAAAVELFSDLEDEGQYYLVTVTADAQGELSAVLPSSAFSGDNITATATAGGRTSEFSEPLPAPAGVHSSDTNLNGKVSLSELVRLVQFYNFGGYGCALSGEDGYSPGPGSTACPRHATDYAPADWRIGRSELLRAIQFYNLAGYTPFDEGEDGFCPPQ